MKTPCEYTDLVECPWCHHLHRDSWEFFSDGSEDKEMQCHRCDQPLLVTRHVSVSYSSTRLKQKDPAK